MNNWNRFVKKIYSEGKSKNSSYSFKNALKDASRRKSEMGSMSSMGSTKKHRKHRSSRKSRRR
jgi:hypothetical protein